jgi:RNA polymerase sigma-54 factor
MALSQSLQQKLLQKLSPQQIQLWLLQVPTLTGDKNKGRGRKSCLELEEKHEDEKMK